MRNSAWGKTCEHPEATLSKGGSGESRYSARSRGYHGFEEKMSGGEYEEKPTLRY